VVPSWSDSHKYSAKERDDTQIFTGQACDGLIMMSLPTVHRWYRDRIKEPEELLYITSEVVVVRMKT